MFPSLLKRKEYTVSECPFSSVSNVPSARSQTRIRLSTPINKKTDHRGTISAQYGGNKFRQAEIHLRLLEIPRGQFQVHLALRRLFEERFM